MKIPRFDTTAGNEFPAASLGKDDLQICICNCTVDECREYAKKLETEGFTQYAASELSAGSSTPYNVNLFYTYVREDMHLFVFWDASLHTTRIVATPPHALPSVEKPKVEQGDDTPTTVTQMQCGGMGFVVQLPDESFILIDGGRYREGDMPRLYSFLKDHTTKREKPLVAAWLFSHADYDHIELAEHFLQDHAADIDILSFAYNFPDADKISIVLDVTNGKQGIARLEENMQKYYPEAAVYTLRTGQKYLFKGVEIEILWTVDNTYPATYISFNDVCAAWRMKFDNGKTVLFLGDCIHPICRQLAHTYGDYVKSDALQVAHHGLLGGDKGLYQLVDPEICFWSVMEERFFGRQPEQRYQWCLGEGGCDYNAWIRDDSVRVRKHYHNSVTTTLEVNKDL